jgi:hypothetical protein
MDRNTPQQPVLADQVRIQQQQQSQQRMAQTLADVQERTARAMRRYTQSQIPVQAAQGVDYWRPPQ